MKSNLLKLSVFQSRLKLLLNHDFRQTMINQLWRLISGPLLLALVPLYLTVEIQGYWYTFVSLAALAIFADMGFSSVLLLFSSHEFAYLKFKRSGRLTGDIYHLERLATLWRFSLKWSISMALIVFPLVLATGYFILSGRQTDSSWEVPWIIYGVASILVFVNSMLLSFIEGCDSVGDVQKIRFQISIITVISTVIFLIGGEGLYALAVSLFIGALSGMGIIFYKYKKLIIQLHFLEVLNPHPWVKEIMPLVWRFAVSWISGYFIFSSFTPIAFHYYGAIEAGKVGLSLSVCMAIYSISNTWVNIGIPKINMYAARADYASLKKILKRSLLMSLITYFFGVSVFFLILSFVKNYFPIAERLISPVSFVFLSVGWFFQIAVSAIAVYLRAFKQEPFVLVSMLNGVFVFSITMLVAVNFSVDYLFLGFLGGYLFVVPWALLILKYHNRKFS